MDMYIRNVFSQWDALEPSTNHENHWDVLVFIQHGPGGSSDHFACFAPRGKTVTAAGMPKRWAATAANS